jgi:hypothetical protein
MLSHDAIHIKIFQRIDCSIKCKPLIFYVMCAPPYIGIQMGTCHTDIHVFLDTLILNVNSSFKFTSYELLRFRLLCNDQNAIQEETYIYVERERERDEIKTSLSVGT